MGKENILLRKSCRNTFFIYSKRKINGFNAAAVNSAAVSFVFSFFFIKSAKIHRMHYGLFHFHYIHRCSLFLFAAELQTHWWNVLFSQLWFIWHGFIMKMLKNGVSAKANKNNDELRLQRRHTKKNSSNKKRREIERKRFKMVTKLCHG